MHKSPPPDRAASHERHIDSLVATYAPLGRRHRRKVRRKRIAVLFSLSAFVAAGSALFLADVHQLIRWDGGNQHYLELRELLTAELSALSAERRELERYRQMFEQRSGELSAKIAEVDAQRSDLELQRQAFEEQSSMIAKAIGDIDTKRRDLQRRRDPAQALDEEITAISTQRKALEERWKQFEAQGELLATEIIAVNAQRRELAAQQRLMEQQQKQLQALIDRAIANDDRSRATSGGNGFDDAKPLPPPEPEQIAYAGPAVGDGTLGEMRGGINIGGNLEVALGVTHTGSINGVEQFRNNFVIDDMGGDLGALDMSNVNATLIQNGDGNFAAPEVFDALSGSFGSAIQNTLDDQVIATSTIYDISIENTGAALQGLAATEALSHSLDMTH